jgi:hypothetical protein
MLMSGGPPLMRAQADHRVQHSSAAAMTHPHPITDEVEEILSSVHQAGVEQPLRIRKEPVVDLAPIVSNPGACSSFLGLPCSQKTDSRSDKATY